MTGDQILNKARFESATFDARLRFVSDVMSIAKRNDISDADVEHYLNTCMFDGRILMDYAKQFDVDFPNSQGN